MLPSNPSDKSVTVVSQIPPPTLPPLLQTPPTLEQRRHSLSFLFLPRNRYQTIYCAGPIIIVGALAASLGFVAISGLANNNDKLLAKYWPGVAALLVTSVVLASIAMLYASSKKDGVPIGCLAATHPGRIAAEAEINATTRNAPQESAASNPSP